MFCPHCKDVTLAMTERQGIEIDYCPTCRGIWLDRGELDRLIERAEREAAPSAMGATPPPPPLAGVRAPGPAPMPAQGRYREGGEGGEGGERGHYREGGEGGERGYGHGGYGHGGYGHGTHPRRKKSLLGDLFDF